MNAAAKEAISLVQPHKQQQQKRENTQAHQNAIENVHTNENENQNKTENRTVNVQNFNETKITITPPTLIPPTVASATAACIAAAVHVNEETEIAAMVMEDGNIGNRGVDYDATTAMMLQKATATATATATPPLQAARVAATQPATTVEAREFVVPATPIAPGATKGIAVGAGGIKKKRSKSTKKRGEESETRLSSGGVHHKHRKDGARNVATTLTGGVAGGSGSGVAGASGIDAAVNATTTSMKTSISMTSLPPDDEKSERRDVIKAKLQVERPYNSLKKNIERNVVGATLAVMPYSGSSAYSHHSNSSSSFANHRYSWGSGYSYSSSSLHSNATLGLGSAKDDLWAAIQTNYNYIMDTNLLDTCRETERHLAEQNRNSVSGGALDCNQSTCCLKLLGVTQRREMLWHDPNELRKWLREMEERLERAPTVSAATSLSTVELERCLAEHSVLYHEIVSHARIVSACIREATEKTQQEELLQGQHQQHQQQQQQLEDEQQLNSLSSCATLAEHNNLSLSSNEEVGAVGATSTEIEAEPNLSSRNCNSSNNNNNNNNNNSSSSSSGIETTINNNTTVDFKSNASELKDTSLRSSASSPSHSGSGSGSGCATDSGNQSIEGNLERLQNRYHLLYLKAFEVQLWLDGLLRKRGSNTSIVDCGADYVDDVEGDSSECADDDDDDDENAAEAAATEDDFNGIGSGLESDITHNSSSFCDQHFSEAVKHNCRRVKGDCEDGDDEEEDEDEIDYGGADHVWPRPTYSAVLVTYDQHGNADNPIAATTLTDFEADSESSDWEIAQQRLRPQRNKGYMSNCSSQLAITSTPATPNYDEEALADGTRQIITPTQLIAENNIIAGVQATIAYVDAAADGSLLVAHQSRLQDTADTANATTSMKVKMNELDIVGDILSLPPTPTSPATNTTALATTTTTSTATQTQTQQKLQTLHSNNQLTATPSIKQKNIAVISPNSHNNNQKSPTVLRKHRQQQHFNDISKFNRSNRKSKNCAIFYFKHLDTDNETNCSSAGDVADAQADALPDGLSSSASQTSEHLLKSADASSDDDEGWQYSSVASPVLQKHEVIGESCRNINNLNVNVNIDNNKSGNCITAIVLDGIQSSTVSSSTGTTTATTATAVTIIGDDSDKEFNTDHTAATIALQGIVNSSSSPPAVASSLQNSATQITHAEIQLAVVPVTTTKSSVKSFVANTNVSSASGSGSSQSSSSYSTRSSSCSSNDLLTETTSATTATQITQMHFQRVHRTEMELQINGGCYNKSQPITDGDGDVNGNSNSNTINNTKTHIKANNNNSNNNASTMIRNNNRNCGNNNNHNPNNSGNNNNNNNNNVCNSVVRNAQQQQQQQLDATNGNMQKLQNQMYFYTRADICNITGRPTSTTNTTNPPNKCLPPRTPHKSHKSHQLSSLQRSGRGNATTSTRSPTKAKLSHESIKQLVLEAEHLVRDSEALKTPTKHKQKHSMVKLSSTVKKREVIMPGPIKQRVQEWLEHQPSTPMQLHKSSPEMLLGGANINSNARADDCEASGEASETDSVPHHSSDTSEGFTDSIATCMQTSTNSYGGNSTERIGGSAEPIISPTTVLGYGSSNQSLNDKIVKRTQSRRKSERPWSVSCLSQLTTETVQTATAVTKVSNVQAGLATHSISESALDSLSPGRQRVSSSSTAHVEQVKTSTSKGSLKRRKTRKKKSSSGANLSTVTAATYSAGKKTPDTGSEETTELPRLTQTLLMKSCESMSAQQIQEVTNALLSLQRNSAIPPMEQSKNSDGTIVQQAMSIQQQQTELQLNESSEEGQLMKPNFRVGSYTTAYMRNEKRLGSLAALATYRNDEDEEQQGEYTTGTEDHHSSFSETAWDNYQEKYNSENYSEGFDSDAARKLMEFGDDYRNFIDSQSDCCSSLSAANNLDSLSPPRMNSLQQNEVKVITQDTIVTSVDHARRRRALDLEYERGRKTLETRRKSCQDCTEVQNPRNSGLSLSSSANALTPKNGAEKPHQQYKVDSANRKLEFGMHHSAQSLRRTSESDTSTRRRKVDERRRSSRNLDKSIKLIPATSSSSCDDSDDEKEMRNLLHQSRNRLEDTRALKIRCHLLRPEDYTEIINTCRDNIRCLEAVLRGPPGTVLSAQCASQTKDLLAAWEDLLGWSENAAAARKMQEEMIILKHSLNRLGNKASFELLDTEPQIQIAIESLKNEKSQLQNYRTNMLRLNASVHSWLTRQERRLQNALNEQEELKQAGAAEKVTGSTAEQQQVSTAEQQIQQETIVSVTAKVVTDNNGNTMETQVVGSGGNTATDISTNSVGNNTTTSNSVGSKIWDLHTLINSENEFHKHLKDEVSDMYSAWDEADIRISTQLEMLTSSLLAWRQLECGLYEFQQALGQDRGTLKGLEGALDKGQTTPVELAQNVKVVAKLLSERVHVSQEQLTAVQEHLDPNHILHIAKFTASNGSLSDSGISDGGATSDGGLSERERRLGVLRRLVKQLESALAPGSEAMKSIAARMESAEAELKNLQNTCRDLIVRTAATHQHKKLQQQKQQQQQSQQTELEQLKEVAGDNALPIHNSNGDARVNGHAGGGSKKTNKQAQSQQLSTSPKRKNRRKQRKYSAGSNAEADASMLCTSLERTGAASNKDVRLSGVVAPDSGDPSDDPSLEFDLDSSDDDGAKSSRNSWAWRIAKAAVPMQLALFTFLCAACLMQPNCCDNINNLSMSFTPQLRYIRGPPPI